MKKKTAKQPKQSKPTAAVKDLKPKKDAKGGRGDILIGAGPGAAGPVK